MVQCFGLLSVYTGPGRDGTEWIGAQRRRSDTRYLFFTLFVNCRIQSGCKHSPEDTKSHLIEKQVLNDRLLFKIASA